jgi:hypothetical protein
MKGQLLSSMVMSAGNMTGLNNNNSSDSCNLDPRGEKLLRRLVLGKGQQGVTEHLPSALSETPYFNSALILYDASVIRSYNDVTQSSSSTVVELIVLYHLLGDVFKGGDQAIQSVYWMYLRDRSDFGVLENDFWDNGELRPYSFEPPQPTQNERQDVIISGGNIDRPICRLRPVNKALFFQGKDESPSLEEKRVKRWNERRSQREWRLKQKK